jgi:RNA-directed DNA polymerase
VTKRLSIQQCFLYAIASPKDLARRLSTKYCQVTPEQLESLAGDAGNFNVFLSRKNGKPRMVQQPRPKLQRLHRRVHDLLSRIETPDYLHSAVAGRSYITNAAAHHCGVSAIKIDVKKFFQSVPRGAVYRFFAGPMRCNPEVAGLLARLLTYAGHLPTGGSASPIIAYYAFKEMFDAIHDLARAKALTMTCYVDDMGLSGVKASRSVLHEVRLLIASHGLKSHKVKFIPANRPMIITGVAVTAKGLRVPNRRHRAISEGFGQYRAAADATEANKAFTKLVSRMHEAGQIEPHWKARAHTLQAEHARKTKGAGEVSAAGVSTEVGKEEMPEPRCRAA